MSVSFNSLIDYQTYVANLPKPANSAQLPATLKRDEVYIPAGNWFITSSLALGKDKGLFIDKDAKLAFSSTAKWLIEGELYLGNGTKLPKNVRIGTGTGRLYTYNQYVFDFSSSIIPAGRLGPGSPDDAIEKSEINF